jgi:DNA-binding response OmpR family regulator
MTNRPKAIGFDVDSDSLISLYQAFPEWQIEVLNGATVTSLDKDWNPGEAELLIVGARAQVAEALGLCRGLRSQAGRALTPLLVLVQSAQGPLVRAALEAGANSCLVLPVQAADLAGVVTRARAGNRPGRHTGILDKAQSAGPWRDEGGEA